MTLEPILAKPVLMSTKMFSSGSTSNLSLDFKDHDTLHALLTPVPSLSLLDVAPPEGSIPEEA